MTERELEEFVEVADRFREKYASSPERARRLPIELGAITESGDIAEPYASAEKFA